MPAFAALADDTRVHIVELLAGGERSVNELVELFTISQPAVSRHLRVLREAGIVEVTPAGKQRIYGLNPAALGRSVAGPTVGGRRGRRVRRARTPSRRHGGATP